jgi:hypothetical protein
MLVDCTLSHVQMQSTDLSWTSMTFTLQISAELFPGARAENRTWTETTLMKTHLFALPWL